jgi:hypothetical protein
LYFQRKKEDRERDRQVDLAKLTGWFAADAVANQFAKDPKRSLDELWPNPKPKIKTPPAKLKAACTAHKINLLEEPKDAICDDGNG